MPNELPKTEPLPDITGSTRNPVRVAVIQLAYHEALRGSLADPFGKYGPEGTQSLSTLPRGVSPPSTLTTAHQGMSDRIEQAYLKQLVLKLRALLTTCREWGVKLVVLPEYSVPAAALEAVVEAAGDMVVVAGTCFVDPAVRKSGVYERLDMGRPGLRQSVAPVINAKPKHRFVAKLHATSDEAGFDLELATQWEPVPLPDLFGGPLGVLICLDFLTRQSPSYAALVAPKLDKCRLLAVPAHSSERSFFVFDGHGKEEANVGRRPVLLANYAKAGQSTIFVNELSLDELREFPVHAGVLEAGEEGLLVVDVDLAVVGVGKTGRYGEPLQCKPFAAASLVYSGATPALAAWQREIDALLPRDLGELDEGDVLELAVDWLEKNPPPRAGESLMQKRRWDRLYQDLARVGSLEAIRRLTRDVVLPAEVLPLPDLETSLAQGAARVMDRWILGGVEAAAPFATVAENLKEKVRRGESRKSGWSDVLKSSWVAVVESISGTPGPGGPTMITPLDRATDAVENEVVGPALKEGNDRAREGNHALARIAFELARTKALLQGADNEIHGEKWQVWADRAALGAAACAINLQDPEGARKLIEGISVATLSAARRVRLAGIWAALRDVEHSRAVLPAISALPDDLHAERRDVVQRIGLVEGDVPPTEALSSAPDVAVTAAFVLLARGDAARAAEVACRVLERPDEMALFRAQAMHALLNATISTVNDLIPTTGHIPVEARARVVGVIEGQMPLLMAADLPPSIRRSLLRPWAMYLVIVGEDDEQRDLMREVSADAEVEEASEDEKPLLTAALEAQRLVEQGHLEAALAALPLDTHPWRRRLTRVDLLRLGGQHDRATAEALALARDMPFCAPIERTVSQLLSMSGRHDEALPHAVNALAALPARGLRLRVAQCLLSAGRAQEAWNTVVGDELAAGPRMLYALASAADRVHPEKSLSLWKRYVASTPRDASARVHVARLLFAANRGDEAATVAWAVFEEHGEMLSVDELSGVGGLQDALPDEAQRRRRIQAIASTLKERFPGEPRAEKVRLTLLTSMGDLASGNAKIDMDLLEQGGEILAMTTAEVVEMIRSQHDVSQLVAQLGRQGALPIALFCAELRPSLPVPVLVTRLLARRRVPAPFSAPVGLSDVPPGLRLNGSNLLVSEVELYLLGALGLLDSLRKNLDNGRVHLFRGAWMQVLHDYSTLRALAAYNAKERVDEKVAALARLPRLAPGSGESGMSDRQIAQRRGIAFVGSAPNAELQAAKGDIEPVPEPMRLSPLTVLRRLRAQGGISAPASDAMAPYFSMDPETPWMEPVPSPILVSLFFLEKLCEHGALLNFLATFPGAQIGDQEWRRLLDRQSEIIENQQAARLTSYVHAWIAEGMQDGRLEIHPDGQVPGLPSLINPDNAVIKSLVKAPLEWTARYADALAAHPTWWRLAADFLGSMLPIAKEAVPHIAWKDLKTEGEELSRRLSTGDERHVSLPAIARLLLPRPADDEARSKTLWKLAELGFPDALGADEILALFREYNGLDGIVARQVLAQAEWMAREPDHLGAHRAQLRIADVYAAAIFKVFCGAPGHTLQEDEVGAVNRDVWTVLDAEALSRDLLVRSERISHETRTDLLDAVVRFVALRTVSAPRLSLTIDHEKSVVTRRFDGPLTVLWKRLGDWAGTDGVRRAAYDRGVCEAWISIDGSDEDQLRIMSVALDKAVESRHGRGDLNFDNMAIEAEAILSAVWGVRPMGLRGINFSTANLAEPVSVSEEELLVHGARANASLEVDRYGRFVAYSWLMPAAGIKMRVFAPSEAILLRQAPTEAQRFAGYLKRVQGPHDGRGYRLLSALQRRPDRACVRRALARRTVSALWRAVREDPSYLAHWPRSRSLAMKGTRPSLHELRGILSEPSVMEPKGDHFGSILFHRFDAGIWEHREDRWELLQMSCEVPGSLAFGPVRTLLAQEYELHVNAALSILADVADHPIARVARSILLLRAGASTMPTVKLASGESIDLRERLPQLFQRVLEQVLGAPSQERLGAVEQLTAVDLALDTFGEVEPLVIRLCGQVVKDLAGNQVLSIREGLWLTYRLFQWLCLQLDSLPLDARLQGLRALRQLAPAPGPVQDRLDPFGFGRELFDHRLAAVLHALGAMEDVQQIVSGERSSSSAAGPGRLAWQPAMIETLVALASRSDESPGLRSELEWDAPDNIADLALVALYRIEPNAFGRLPPEARLRRFRRLPENPDAMDHADQSLFLAVMAGAATQSEYLSEEERTIVVAKVRAAPKGIIADRWRLLVLPSFFGASVPGVSETEVLSALQEQLDHPLAPMALTYLLFGVARETPERMGEVLNKVIAEAERRNIDPVPLAAGVGRVFLLVDAPVRAMVVELIKVLGNRAPFAGDERMQELVVAFGNA